MKRLLSVAAVATVALAASSASADACARKSISGASKMIQPERGINQSLLERAILIEVNYERCRAGLRPLRAESRLRTAAKGHSEWMAKSRTLSHKSTLAGRSTLRTRLKRTGIKLRTGSENIGMVHRFQVDKGMFKIHDRASCQFATNSGQPIPAHSYQSLARNIVALWMNSSGHRKNIMDSRVSMMGSAAALDPRAEYCGTYYITQNFAG